MSYDELLATRNKHRSEIVLRCVDDYLAGKRIPLSMMYSDPSIFGDVHGA